MSNMHVTEQSSKQAPGFSRRGFLAGAGAAAVGLTILRPELVQGYQANEKVNLGCIGCGGRGTWIAELFQKHGGYNIAAVADYFQDRVDEFGKKLNVKAEARYTGLDGYKRLLEQKLDAVVIESPPYFHPEQAAAGVAAGKHVYLAKPIAVDVPGCKTVEESGKKATSKGLCFLVDFQTRADQFYIERDPARARRGHRQIRVRRVDLPRRQPVGGTGRVRQRGRHEPREPPARLGTR